MMGGRDEPHSSLRAVPLRLSGGNEEMRLMAGALRVGSKLTPGVKPGICGEVTAMCKDQDRN